MLMHIGINLANVQLIKLDKITPILTVNVYLTVSIKKLNEGGGCTQSKNTHVSGCLPNGKQAEMESRLNFHSGVTLKTKVQGGGGATKLKFLRLMLWTR